MILLLLLGLAALSAPQDVRVAVRAGAALECVLHDASGARGDARWTPAGAGEWTWVRLPGDVLRCSCPGFEPLDLETGTALLPAAVSLALFPARVVTLEGDWGALDTLLEWRALPSGPATDPPRGTALLARREVRLAGTVTVAVAKDHRVLRLRPRGASPVSLFVPAGNEPLTLRIPERQPGGEVFGVLPPYAFVPQMLELAIGGRTLTATPDASRVFRAGGLPPGALAMAPRYRGGVLGQPKHLAVAAGESLELLPLDLPEPSAVTLTVADELCDRDHLPARLVLRQWEDAPASSHSLAEQTVRKTPCRWELEGLEEGAYEALMLPATAGEKAETVASARWGAQPGQRASVTLVPPAVRVSGRVTFGEDRPAQEVALTFDYEGQRWTARTDENGEYALSLGEPGDYELLLQIPGGAQPSVSFRRLEAGEQRADLKLPDAAIHVRLGRKDGAPLADPVQVGVIAKTGSRLAGSWAPGTEPELRFAGVERGEYWVTAATGRLASAAEVRVELTAESPLAEVDVLLEERDARLIVVDEQGQPVAEPEVYAGDALLEPRRGVFHLRGVSVGERLKVRAPGYAPVCRIVQAQDAPDLQVALTRQTEFLTLQISVGVPWESALLLGLPGSTCGVELAELLVQQVSSPERHTAMLRLPRGRFEVALGSRSFRVSVPGPVLQIQDVGPETAGGRTR